MRFDIAVNREAAAAPPREERLARPVYADDVLGLRTVGWAVVGYCAYRFIHQAVQGAYFFEDAYMFLRYATNLLHGHGLAWNAGEPQVYGQTSLLHVFVVALVKASLPSSDASVLLLSSALAGAALLAGLVATCAHCTRSESLHRKYLLWAAVIGVLFCTRSVFYWHLRTGMDTMLSAFCVTLLILAALRAVAMPGAGRIATLVIVAYVAYLARPDNGLYAVLFPTLAILLLAAPDRRRKSLVGFVAGIVALLGLDAVVKWRTFGDVLPLAFYAKRAGYYAGYEGASYWNPITYLGDFFSAAAPFLVALAILSRKRDLRLLAAFFTPVVLLFAYYFGVLQIMGHMGRYYYPSLPFVLVASALVVDARLREPEARRVLRAKTVTVEHDLGERIHSRWPSPSFVLVAGAAFLAARLQRVELGAALRAPHVLARLGVLVVLLLLGQLTGSIAAWYDARFLRVDPPRTRPAYHTVSGLRLPEPALPVLEGMAEIVSTAPPATSVALTEFGLVGARAPEARLIDIVGLHDRQFAHRGFSATALFDRRPDLIWFPHMHYRTMIHDIVTDRRFWREYEYFPRAFLFGLAIRRASPRRDLLLRAIEPVWRRYYPGFSMKDFRAEPDR